jgi:hypothetical protein
MTTNAFPYDPHEPVLTFDDMRLTRAFQWEPQRCATLNEYANVTGISVDVLLDLFCEPLERGALDVEAVGGEIFVHTAPNGRPGPRGSGQVPPNLWELLRRDHDENGAFALWRITRDLQAGGWKIEADPRHIPSVSSQTALLGLRFANSVVPVVVFPEPETIASQSGPLTRYEISTMGLAAVLCRHRELDTMITAVRRWMLGRPARAGLDVIVLESPRYQPVLLTSDDGGLNPRSVSVETFGPDAS